MMASLLAAALALSGVASGSTAQEYDLRQWTVRDGLPQSSITGIAQSDDGYLWLTTFGGITRFDGERFTVYDLASNPELGSERFVGVVSDADGTLWFGALDDGLVRMRDGVFERVPLPDAASDAVVFELLVDDDGSILAWVGDVLLRIEGDRQTVIATSINLTRPSKLRWGAHGDLWAVGRDHNTCLVGACEASEWHPDSSEGVRWDSRWGRPSTCSEPFLSAVDGWLWLQRWRGREWCTNGAVLSNEEESFALATSASTTPYVVTDSFVDREGTLWLGTAGQGLLQFLSLGIESFDASDGLPKKSTRRVVEDGDGRIWVLSGYALRTIVSDQVVEPPAAFEALGPIGDIAVDVDGVVWLTTADQLWRYDDGVLALAEPDAAGGALLVDDRGAVWLSDKAAIERLGSDERWPAIHGQVEVIRHTPDGALWLGTSEGVVRAGEEPLLLSVSDGLAAGVIRDLMVEEDGTIWAGSYGGGMSRIRVTEAGVDVVGISPVAGLCEGVVSRILRVGDDLWMNGNRGVSHVRLDALHAVADGRLERVQCELYDSGEGNGNSGLIASDGSLWFPTLTGVVRLEDPAADEVVLPLAKIEAAEVDDASLSEGGEVLPERGDLAVRYTGLGLSAPEGLQFRHRLVGHDETWRSVGAERSARYINLAPGAYRFEVQVRGLRGGWSDTDALSFTLRPALYQTRWFQGLCLLLGAGIIALLVRLRVSSVRRQAEERLALQAQLQQAQKLEALGQLAGGIAHDFNNMLTIIGANAAFLQEVVPVEEQDLARDIRDAVRRSQALTNKLLIFARRDVTALRVLSLQESTQSLLDVLRRLLPEDISLRVVDAGEPIWLRVDPVRFEQVLMNLLVNARDAIGRSGVIEVATDLREVGSAEARRHGVAPGRYAVLSVRDDGEGIPEGLRSRIFEPFFTTRQVGKGTGLGLATVHGAVRDSQGFVTVESQLGEGACFLVYFPAVEPPIRRSAASDVVSLPAPSQGTILVCDDEPALRRTLVRMLEESGYRVLESESPGAALRCVNEVDLLVTDVVMPEMNGPELVERVREISPEIPVLYISGHTRDTLRSRGLDDNAALLNKPFSQVELLAEIDALLDSHHHRL